MAETTETELSEPQNLSLDSLTDELLAHCFSFLEAKDLSIVEFSCTRFKRCIQNGKLWAAKCNVLFPAFAHLLDTIETSELEEEWPSYRGNRDMQLSAACKRLFSSLAASSQPDEFSLICDPLGASSQDHIQENLGRTLSPQVRGRHNLFCYWSSLGSEDENSKEWVAYRLCHPLCVVSNIQIRPFRAWFQGHSPIYAPKRVSVGFGGIPLLPTLHGRESYTIGLSGSGNSVCHINARRFEKMEEERRNSTDTNYEGTGGRNSPYWATLTKEYPILQEDKLQTMHLPPQTLCVGRHLQINLHGRTQRQEADDQYYTCLGYVRAEGAPIYNFELIRGESRIAATDQARQPEVYLDEEDVPLLQLKLRISDPLRRIGGLKEWSELRRCADASMEYARELGLPDPSDNYSGSEIGSEEMELGIDEFDELDGIL